MIRVLILSSLSFQQVDGALGVHELPVRIRRARHLEVAGQAQRRPVALLGERHRAAVDRFPGERPGHLVGRGDRAGAEHGHREADHEDHLEHPTRANTLHHEDLL